MSTLFLLASVGGHRIVFHAASIQSVVELEKLTPAPGTPPHIAGLAALRSRPMTVIDCALSLGLDEGCGASRKAVVVEQGAYLYALSVDRVDDVISMEEEIEPVPSELAPGWQRVARGMIRHEGKMVLLADPAGFIDGPQKKAA
jgi:purine-binding chemotaxis protein CheW